MQATGLHFLYTDAKILSWKLGVDSQYSLVASTARILCHCISLSSVIYHPSLSFILPTFMHTKR